MGTSSMYKGRNSSPLLPPDFNDEDGKNPNHPNLSDNPVQNPHENNPDEENNPSEKPFENEIAPLDVSCNNPKYSSWRAAKNSMSKYASGNGGQNGMKNAVSSYVKSYGGARNAAKLAKSARRTTIKIGDFFGGVSKKGIEQVLNDYNIQIEGRKPKDILNDIVNILAPTPDVNDNSVARKALINTMSIIYEKFEDENKDISLLDSLHSDIVKILISKYIETFIYERLLHDVGSRIEMKSENSNAASKIEKEIKEYIESKVSVTLKEEPLSSINSQTKNVEAYVEKLYKQCYKVLEGRL